MTEYKKMIRHLNCLARIEKVLYHQIPQKNVLYGMSSGAAIFTKNKTFVLLTCCIKEHKESPKIRIHATP